MENTKNLSVLFGTLRLRCHGAVAKTVADEIGMEPGDLLLTDAISGEAVLIPWRMRYELSQALLPTDE